MPLFQYTPNLALGAIILTAVLGLIDVPAAYQIWKIDKFDFFVLLCAFFGVLFVSVQDGLAIAVGVFVLKLLMQITRPKTLVLGNICGTDVYCDLHQNRDVASIPAVADLCRGSIGLQLSASSKLFLMSMCYIKSNSKILRWMQECDENNGKEQCGLKFDLSVDTNGVSFFRDLRVALENKNLARVGDVMEKLERGEGSTAYPLFLSVGPVGEAVASLLPTIRK